MIANRVLLFTFLVGVLGLAAVQFVPAMASSSSAQGDAEVTDADDSDGSVDIASVAIHDNHGVAPAAVAGEEMTVSTHDPVSASSFDDSVIQISFSNDSDSTFERYLTIRRSGPDRLVTAFGNVHNVFLGYGQTFYNEGEDHFTVVFPAAILGKGVSSYRYRIFVQPSGTGCSGQCSDYAPDSGWTYHRIGP